MAKSKLEKVTNDSTSDSTSAYCKMPDGTLIQWGSTMIASGGYTGSFQLPVTLADLSSSTVHITPLQTETDFSVNYSDSSNSTISIGRTPSTNNSYYYWLVIGRWK